jgi:small subunit ribosomal protein S25
LNSRSILEQERIASIKAANPANFGDEFEKHCICELPGQLPCPSLVMLPKKMRGKYVYGKVVED